MALKRTALNRYTPLESRSTLNRTTGLKSGGTLKRTPINRRSKKQIARDNQYNPQAKRFKQAHPLCEINSPVCTGHTNDVHHVRGRIGDLLFDERWFKASCRACHDYLDHYKGWARENGLVVTPDRGGEVDAINDDTNL